MLACMYAYRSLAVLERPEFAFFVVLGYLCRSADTASACPRFLWWTALFHVFVAYSMCLVGLQLRGVYAPNYMPHIFPVGLSTGDGGPPQQVGVQGNGSFFLSPTGPRC